MWWKKLPDGQAAERRDDASDYTPSIAPAGDVAEAGDFEVDVPDEFVDGLHEDGLHEEFEEKTEKAGLPRPVQPTLREIEEHQIAHVPYRSWCAHCVSWEGSCDSPPTQCR